MPLRQDRIIEPLTPALTAAFRRTVSLERWRTYQLAAGFNDDLAHRLYLWNACVGQSFHFPLQSVEVALRNVIHISLVNLYGPSWASDATCRAILKPQQTDAIDKAVRRHRSIYKNLPSTSQIVASLSLGFWIATLSRHYGATIWTTQVATAFPHIKPHETMVDVSRTGMTIQDLRNRIFHQEPLIGQNLSVEYSAILKMLAWICPDTREWVRHHSSVSIIIRERPR